MTNSLEYPKLRWPLELRMETVENESVLLINCPLGIAPAPLLLVPAVAPIISCFEGQLSIDEIVGRFQQYGVKRELVLELVKILDNGLFLAGPRFASAEAQAREEFAQAMVRPAALAGSGYSALPAELAREIERHLKHSNGAQFASSKQQLLGLVSPHIDYRRGGPCYGITYNVLREQEHDLYIVLGTAHQYSRNLFHLTRKDFANPLGMLGCDREFVEKLAARYGHQRSFAEEILHRKEHSLELQMPFLRHLKQNPKIVPILVGSFYQMMVAGKEPSNFDEYESFAGGLTECIRTRIQNGSKVCIIAGVDMAHVGQSFGDTGQLSAESMKKIAERDQVYLDAIVEQDKKKLFSHIAEDRDARRICGFPTMYTVLDIFDRLGTRYKAKLFDYRQAVDYVRDCAVTFAGIGMYSAL